MGAENTRFNAKAYIDFKYIEGVPILHMVDDATHFSAAQFVDSWKQNLFGNKILTLWAAVYTGLSNTLVSDDGSQFRDTFE